MWRFIITILLGGIVHGVGCIINPPFEFGGGRLHTFFFALTSGFIFTSVFVVLLFMPLRAALRRFMPRAQIGQMIVAAMTLLLVAAAWTGVLVLSHHTFMYSYQSYSAFWSVYAVVLSFSFF